MTQKKQFSKGGARIYQGRAAEQNQRKNRPQNQVIKVQTASPARKLALHVLTQVHSGGAFASLSLNDALQEGYFRPEDRRLATTLVYGVLENEKKLDYILAQFMDHPTEDVALQDILRMGVYQLLNLDRVPESAAVNDAVILSKGINPAASGMVNGVLRNVIRGKDQLSFPDKEQDYTLWLSVLSSTPEWLTERMIADWGREEAEQLLLYREQEHGITIRPNLLKTDDAAFEKLLAKKTWTVRKGLVPHAWIVTGAAALNRDSDYLSGMFSIQGQSSMMAAEAMGARPGQKLLDVCAAPGGKSAYLCEQLQLTGRVFAWELHEKRAALIESAKRRLGLENLRISVRDGTVVREDLLGTMDGVLLDAPCSGLGVMAQKPDIKQRLKPEDLEEIAQTQRKLLDAVCGYVKKGGVLVYSTCTVVPGENREQVQAFLERHPEFQVEELPAACPEAIRQRQTPLGIQLLPHRDGVEGFFICRMRRVR